MCHPFDSLKDLALQGTTFKLGGSRVPLDPGRLEGTPTAPTAHVKYTVLRELKFIPVLRTRMIVAMVCLVCSDQLS